MPEAEKPEQHEKPTCTGKEEARKGFFNWLFRHRFIIPFTWSVLAVAAGIWVGVAFMTNPFGMGKVTLEDPDALRDSLRERASRPMFSGEGLEDLRSILSQNMKAFFILMVGILTLGVSTLFELVVVGISIGAPIAISTGGERGLPLGQILAFLIPHGFFEIAGFCIAGSLGFRGLLIFIRFLRGEGQLVEKEELRKILRLAVLSAFIVVFAAYFEAFITPAIGGMLL